VHIQLRGLSGIDGTQKLQKFAAAMAPVQLADDLARGDVQDEATSFL
jgi:hypothetical protein